LVNQNPFGSAPDAARLSILTFLVYLPGENWPLWLDPAATPPGNTIYLQLLKQGIHSTVLRPSLQADDTSLKLDKIIWKGLCVQKEMATKHYTLVWMDATKQREIHSWCRKCSIMAEVAQSPWSTVFGKESYRAMHVLLLPVWKDATEKKIRKRN